jgi:vesicular inhibitory amino acid transporter
VNEIGYFIILISTFYNRETTDSYTIATAPTFGSMLKGPSFIYSSFTNRSKSNLEIDGKTPFLSSGLDQGTVQTTTWWEKGSMQNLVGEMPIGYGCSLTQTVFNGMVYIHDTFI